MDRFERFNFVVVTNNCTHTVHTTDRQAAEEAVKQLEAACGLTTEIKKIFVA